MLLLCFSILSILVTLGRNIIIDFLILKKLLLTSKLRSTTLLGRSAWTPVQNTYDHFITFDLGTRKKIRKIATAGRARTHECVTEFVVQFSDDGELWRSYTDVLGEVQVNKFVSRVVLN